jgi:hypothetical protein
LEILHIAFPAEWENREDDDDLPAEWGEDEDDAYESHGTWSVNWGWRSP